MNKNVILALVIMVALMMGALLGSAFSAKAEAQAPGGRGRCIGLAVREPPTTSQQLLSGWAPLFVYRAWENGTVEMLHKDVAGGGLSWLLVDEEKPKATPRAEPKTRGRKR